MQVKCSMNDDEDGHLTARLSGVLDRDGTGEVYTALLEALAALPDVLLVDVSDLDVRDPHTLSVFTAVVRQAALWPGAPVLLCGAGPVTRRLLRAPAYQRIPVFHTVDRARREAGIRRPVLPVIRERLLPIAGAARQARDVTTDACLRWELPHLMAPACLVAGELVSNVVAHAGTMMTLRLSVTGRHLRVAVYDGSPVMPVAPGPAVPGQPTRHGLRLVAQASRCWGSQPSADGKVVWASLKLGPRADGGR
jgi:hypothetical protein